MDNAIDAIRIKEIKLGTDESNNVRAKVSYLKDVRQVEIRFIDTGIGIKQEDRSSIFLPYFTTKGSGTLYENFAKRKKVRKHENQQAKNAVVGTGLGLDLVKNLVENLIKGSIKVESEYGKGTTFIVAIPEWNEVKL